MFVRDIGEVGERRHTHRPAQHGLEYLQVPGRAGLSDRRDL